MWVPGIVLRLPDLPSNDLPLEPSLQPQKLLSFFYLIAAKRTRAAAASLNLRNDGKVWGGREMKFDPFLRMRPLSGTDRLQECNAFPRGASGRVSRDVVSARSS